MTWPQAVVHPFWPRKVLTSATAVTVENGATQRSAVGVGLIDVLFGLVLGAIFQELVKVGSPAGEWARWTELIVALSVLVLSWIGFHKTRAFDPTDVSFIDPVSFQYVVDMAIVASYFALAQTAVNGSRHSVTVLTALLAAIAGLYCLWDVIGALWHTANPAKPMARERLLGSFVLAAVFAVTAIAVAFVWKIKSDAAVVVWGLVVLLVLVKYRVDQNYAESYVKTLCGVTTT